MAKKMVLTEYYELCEGGVCRDLLSEDEKRQISEGKMILTGKLQAADQKNGNGRIYPEKVLKREVKNLRQDVSKGKGAVSALILIGSFIAAVIGYFSFNGN